MSSLRALALCVVIVSCAPQNASSDAPLPHDLSIVAPGPDIPPAAAQFSGLWRGAWGGTMAHVLVVEKIPTPTTAMIVYSVGANPSIGIQPSWWRSSATIENDTLVYQDTSGALVVRYKPQSDGSLAATYRNGLRGWYGSATMKK